MELGYVATNPYHNNVHAADVTQTMSFFITKPFLLPYVKPLEVLASLLAAAIHDYRHPGVNNAFHVAIGHNLAITYNDKSVLEAMHVASFYRLIQDPLLNALSGLSKKDFNECRSLMIDMVLGTDMAHHFEEIAKFKSKLLQVARESSTVRTHPRVTCPMVTLWCREMRVALGGVFFFFSCFLCFFPRCACLASACLIVSTPVLLPPPRLLCASSHVYHPSERQGPHRQRRGHAPVPEDGTALL